ncbi:hypothetical protein COOONC_20147 [Cooperia oncophora]
MEVSLLQPTNRSFSIRQESESLRESAEFAFEIFTVIPETSHSQRTAFKEAEDETETATSWKSAKELFTEPHLRRAVLLSISALQNTVALWSMLLSSTYFLEEIGLDQAVASWSSTAMTLGYVLGTLAGSTWIERFGRRTILLSFTIVDNLLLVFYVVCAEMSPIVKQFRYSCLVLLIAYAFVYG